MIPKNQYKNFPASRYMGSKNKIISELEKVFLNLNFKSAIDLFAGSCSVSYLLKSLGKKVITNDYLNFSFNISKAIIENNKFKLNKKDIEKLTYKPKKYNKFVQNTFNDIFFSNEDNDFIDIIRNNLKTLNNEYKKALALASLIKACQKKQPRGLFTFAGFRYDDGRKDLIKSIKEHFYDAIDIFNNSVFDNKKKNISLNKDFAEVNNNADLIYIDPPYFSKLSDNEYVRRYHFIEGLARDWQGIDIQHTSKVKKFKKYPSLFDTELGSKNAIKFLIKKYNRKVIVFSYSSNSIPDLIFFENQAKINNMKMNVTKIKYTYSFGTQKKSSKMKNKVEEYIIVIKK